MSPTQLLQRRDALASANHNRLKITDLRKRLTSEHGMMREVMENPPPELASYALVDVVRLMHSQRCSKSIQRLGAMAIHHRINLMIPLGKASLASRRWVARNAEWNWRASKP